MTTTWLRISALLFFSAPFVPQSSAQDTSAAEKKFQPAWESLEKNYRCPEWFRDAKFGIWAHWSAQCVPEQGDWYARNMYIQVRLNTNIM